jgi:hypothetical protein
MSMATSEPGLRGATRCTSVTGPTRQLQERPLRFAVMRAGTGTAPRRRTYPRAPRVTSGSPRPQAPRTCGAHSLQRAGSAISAQVRVAGAADSAS